MPKHKTRAEGRDKPRPTPDVQEKPEAPEKKAGPLPAPATRAPEEATGAAGRARTMTDMQQVLGNARVSRMLGTTVQTKPVVDTPDSPTEQEANRVADTVMRMPESEVSEGTKERSEPLRDSPVVRARMEADEEVRRRPEPNRPPGRSATMDRGAGRAREISAIQRQPAAGTAAAQAPRVQVPQAILDQVISASIVQTLRSFQNIPIEVAELVPLPAGQAGPPTPVTKTVHVSAAYFINTARARAHYAGARRAARFRAIKRELRRRGAVSAIQSTRGGELAAGRAVEVGKGTPEDIKQVIEEAIRQGVVRRYAIRRGVINRNQRLVDLDEAALQALIQRWVYHVGVGVDCSGFVLQAAIRAREAERALISVFNFVGGLFGMAPQPVPPERSHRIRGAASFQRGPRVRRPSDLRPGDAWVVSGGDHIRIVMAVCEVTLPDGTTAIEFDTAESSGTSTRPTPGPVQRTWRTRSRSRFNPITRVGHRRGAVGGSFHRIP